MSVLTNTVGRKLLMAVSGLVMVLFVIVHLLGNSSIFLGKDALNAYAQGLHSLGPLVWIFRIVMLAMLGTHLLFGVLLTLENWAANPAKYAVNKKVKASFSGETMIWTGALLLAFVVYHLVQFTFRVPGFVSEAPAERPGDVYTMVVSSFQMVPVSLIYVAAMVTLFLHMNHGIQSIFQTLGWNNGRIQPTFEALGKALAVLFLVGYSAIPVFILVRILSK